MKLRKNLTKTNLNPTKYTKLSKNWNNDNILAKTKKKLSVLYYVLKHKN